MIKYTVGNITTDVRVWKFPDTSIGTDINIGGSEPSTNFDHVTIDCRFGDEGFSVNDILFALENALDALRLHYPVGYFHLRMPYVPYTRQDRICNPGEGHSLRVVSRRINSLEFDSVCITDPHSTVTEALINKCYAADQFDVFQSIYPSFGEVYIVAPDAGAVKKCEDFAKKAGAAGVIVCHKQRDLKTGKIIKFEILDDGGVPPGSNFLVLDDLCDRGGTFLAVAAEVMKLHPARVDLAVTHGLFTHEDGVAPLLNQYDMVYTTDSFKRVQPIDVQGLLKVLAI